VLRTASDIFVWFYWLLIVMVALVACTCGGLILDKGERQCTGSTNLSQYVDRISFIVWTKDEFFVEADSVLMCVWPISSVPEMTVAG